MSKAKRSRFSEAKRPMFLESYPDMFRGGVLMFFYRWISHVQGEAFIVSGGGVFMAVGNTKCSWHVESEMPLSVKITHTHALGEALPASEAKRSLFLESYPDMFRGCHSHEHLLMSNTHIRPRPSVPGFEGRSVRSSQHRIQICFVEAFS